MESSQHQQPSRKIQQLGGLFLIAVSSGFILWTWYTAFSQGYFYPKASLIFPMFFFIGLGLLIFPDYKTERINRGEDISQLSGMKLLTVRWWIILVIAILAGIGNFLLVRFF